MKSNSPIGCDRVGMVNVVNGLCLSINRDCGAVGVKPHHIVQMSRLQVCHRFAALHYPVCVDPIGRREHRSWGTMIRPDASVASNLCRI